MQQNGLMEKIIAADRQESAIWSRILDKIYINDYIINEM